MEFENLQVEVPIDDQNDDEKEKLLDPRWEKVYHNKSRGFVVGLDLHSKEAFSRKEKRAKRFGIKSSEGEDVDVQNPFHEIDLSAINFPPITDAAYAEKRPESLHLHGVSKMSTKDVFHYFENHGPDTMEWIDDDSCNVVWESDKMAKTAMNDMSRTYGELRESLVEAIECSKVNEMAAKIWRIALPYKNRQSLFIREATIEDKKLPGAAKRSLYYLKHGNGEQSKGRPGLVSASRKRKIQQANEFVKENLTSKKPEVQFMSVGSKDAESKWESDDVDMDVDDEVDFIPLKASKTSSSKTTHGGMYADRIKTRNPDLDGLPRVGREENLKIEVRNLKESSSKWTAGRRNQHRRDGSSSEDESDDEELNSDSYEQDVSKGPELDGEPSASDLRTKISNTGTTGKSALDLRDKLQQKKNHLGLTKEQLNLCIEVTEISDED